MIIMLFIGFFFLFVVVFWFCGFFVVIRVFYLFVMGLLLVVSVVLFINKLFFLVILDIWDFDVSMESIVECCSVDLVDVGGVDVVLVVFVDGVEFNEVFLVVYDVGFGVEVVIFLIVVVLVIVVDFVVVGNVVFVVVFIEEVVLGIFRKRFIKEWNKWLNIEISVIYKYKRL